MGMSLTTRPRCGESHRRLVPAKQLTAFGQVTPQGHAFRLVPGSPEQAGEKCDGSQCEDSRSPTRLLKAQGCGWTKECSYVSAKVLEQRKEDSK